MAENLLTPELIEEIEEYIRKRLPQVLEQDPNFATFIEGMLAEKFPRRDEFARMLEELHEHRRETRRKFAKVDQRFGSLETEMRTGFDNLHRAIDRLGSRWGIRNEAVFRKAMSELLENSFGATVQERHIRGEQFDCVIANGQHILVEITASVGPRILERLERNRRLYTEETGITPSRFLLVVGSIHSRRAEQLRQAGFEVIEPEDQDDG